jgi:hypothetical protein
MPAHRVTLGITDAGVNPDALEIHFSFVVDDRPPIPFIMGYGPSTQTIGALGRMFLTLQEIAQKQKGKMNAIAAEQVRAAHIQQERWSGNVICQLTTPTGIPYNFVLTREAASDIAARLKTESEKPHQSGSA